jgi:hypothetical protein
MQGGKKLDFAERDKCKPGLLRLSLAGNLEKPLMSLFRTEWRQRGYELSKSSDVKGGWGGVQLPLNTFKVNFETHRLLFFKYFFGGFFLFFSYYIQHCLICRPSDSTVPTDAGIEPRTVATGALAVRRSNHY